MLAPLPFQKFQLPLVVLVALPVSPVERVRGDTLNLATIFMYYVCFFSPVSLISGLLRMFSEKYVVCRVDLGFKSTCEKQKQYFSVVAADTEDYCGCCDLRVPPDSCKGASCCKRSTGP